MIKVFAVGRVAKDAETFEYKKADGTLGTGISFGLICEKFYGDENPTYIHCSKFGPDESLAQHITTGNQFIVEGTLSGNRTDNGTFYQINVDQSTFGQRKK